MKKQIIKIIVSAFILALPLWSFAISNVLTAPAGDFTDISATFSGSANPQGSTTFGYFRYAPLAQPPIYCNDIYGSQMQATSDTNIGNGNSDATFTKTVSNLAPNTTYYFCAIASDQNKDIISYGGVQSFTTKPCSTCAQATTQTNPANIVDDQSANINGFFNIIGLTVFSVAKKQSPSVNVSATISIKQCG